VPPSVPPPDEPPDEPLAGLLRKASPGGDLLAQAALSKLQARLFGRTEVPIHIGRYAIEERIGAGSSGVVYRAFDPKHERKVALKLLHAREDSAHEAARARLLREALALAKLSHPNVVRILDVGTFDPAALDPAGGEAAGLRAPAVYLVMELLDGGDLGRWLALAPRPWQDVREVFLAAGRGLAAAHTQGLVHRDFKPSNVSIDARGHVRVLDFGLARPLAVLAPEPSLRMTGGARQRLDALAKPLMATLTAPGTLLGTPTYMAPEQHERQRATAKSDQYAFCVALYEAWYGQRPFLATTEDELRTLKRRGDVLPPTEGIEVPPHLWPVLRRGLSARPEDRFESMDALLAALVGPAPGWWGRRRWLAAAAPSQRGRWLVAVGSVGALAVGLVAWRSTWRSREASRVLACAQHQRERTAVLLEAVRDADEAERPRLAELGLHWPEASRCEPDHELELVAFDTALADSIMFAAEGSEHDARRLADEAYAHSLAHGDRVRRRRAAAWLGHLALEHGELSEAEAVLADALWSDDGLAPTAALLATIDLLELARCASPRPADAPLWIRLGRERAALPASPPELRARLYLGLHRLALADGDLARAELDLRQALALRVDERDAERARRALTAAHASKTRARP
jgi:serine/threonine protein kinase